MKFKLMAYGIGILCSCFLIQWQCLSLVEGTEKQKTEEDTYEEARAYLELYEEVWKDLTYFPIPLSTQNEEAIVSFENSWMFERTYGGSYGHEGTDIMGELKEPGYYPVLSMTDGIVENMGWLEKGGYRIGIRSPHGIYYYYAHLDSYAEDLEKGSTVLAGQLLGYMGDTGYGEEGTTGMFDVHLHIGIYLKTQEIDEISINPYWFLKSLEEKKLEYSY